MSTYPYLNSWLQCLLQLAPPRGLVHIGAGGGALNYPFAHMPRLLAAEADAVQHARLQTQLQNHAHCQVLQVVVADQSGTADFYTLSQSQESSLCPPAALQALWPNLKTLRTDARQTTTLHALLTQAPDGGATAFNWAIIDCLPAGGLLRGAGECISAWDVVVVRVLKETPADNNASLQAMSLPALSEQLAAFGLAFVAMEEENHPKMVRALFVRHPSQQRDNDKATLLALQTECNELNSKFIAHSADLTSAKDQVVAQRDAEAQAKTEAIAQRDQLAQEKAALAQARDAEANAKAEAIAQRDALAEDKTTLTAARDEQAQLAAERQDVLIALQAQYDHLAQENLKLIATSVDVTNARDQTIAQRDAEVQAKAEAIAQRDQLAQEKAELAQARDAEANAKAEAIAQRDALAEDKTTLTAARDEQAQLAAERQDVLIALQTQRDHLAQENSKLIATSVDLANAREQTIAQRDAEVQANAEAIAQRDQLAQEKAELTQARDAEASAKAEAIAQREALANEKVILTTARDEQTKLAAERQAALATQQQDNTRTQHRLQELETENHECAARQRMLQEELIKAEAQIELIKDLLLREPGL